MPSRAKVEKLINNKMKSVEILRTIMLLCNLIDKSNAFDLNWKKGN